MSHFDHQNGAHYLVLNNSGNDFIENVYLHSVYLIEYFVAIQKKESLVWPLTFNSLFVLVIATEEGSEKNR
jgi:hypothetical protein